MGISTQALNLSSGLWSQGPGAGMAILISTICHQLPPKAWGQQPGHPMVLPDDDTGCKRLEVKGEKRNWWGENRKIG